MTERKPFLGMPPVYEFAHASDRSCDADDVREMREQYEARIAELEKAHVVCCKGCPDCLGIGYSPAVLKDAVARAEKAEARIAELTEWRPMSEAPDEWVVGFACGEVEIVKRFPSGKFCDRDYRIRDVTGWLPLPEVSRG